MPRTRQRPTPGHHHAMPHLRSAYLAAVCTQGTKIVLRCGGSTTAIPPPRDICVRTRMTLANPQTLPLPKARVLLHASAPPATRHFLMLQPKTSRSKHCCHTPLTVFGVFSAWSLAALPPN